MIAEAASFPREVFIIGGDHATLTASSEGLILAETSSRHVSERPCLLPLVGTSKCLGVVLNHVQIVLLREGVEFVHIANIAVKMHRDNRFGSRRYQSLRRFDANAMIIDIHVGEPWNCTSLHD